jgi:molybdopterin synthase sulfur carrier subunit
VDPEYSGHCCIGFYKPDVCSGPEGALLKVTVKFYAHLRDLIGQKAMVELDMEEDATISNLLDELLLDSRTKEVLLDENQDLKPDITILKNGREIRFLAGMDTPLEPGDEISFFPVVAGG